MGRCDSTDVAVSVFGNMIHDLGEMGPELRNLKRSRMILDVFGEEIYHLKRPTNAARDMFGEMIYHLKRPTAAPAAAEDTATAPLPAEASPALWSIHCLRQ